MNFSLPTVRGLVLVLVVFWSARCGDAVVTSGESSPYLDAAVDAGRWLQRHSSDSLGGVIPDHMSDSTSTGALASGAAGRALFFAELYATTHDDSFGQSALASSRVALTWAHDNPDRYGLYNGTLGVAAAVTGVSIVMEDAILREQAQAEFERAAEILVADDSFAIAGDIYDVLAGRAGMGLSMLYAYDVYKDQQFLDAAVRIGDQLIGVADTSVTEGWTWMRGGSNAFDLPNFSHGTAGVDFFFSALEATSHIERFGEAAQNATAYLRAISDSSDGLFLIPYGVPNEGFVTAYDIGWAHGPAGSSRLFYSLSKTTNDPELENLVDAGAETIIASGLPGESADSLRWSGPFSIDRRFGTAGAASFLIDWGLESENQLYLDKATEIVDDILSKGTRANGELFWEVPLYGFQGDGESGTFTGLFYGSAGLGLTLIQLHHALSNGSLQTRLPDNPFRR